MQCPPRTRTGGHTAYNLPMDRRHIRLGGGYAIGRLCPGVVDENAWPTTSESSEDASRFFRLRSFVQTKGRPILRGPPPGCAVQVQRMHAPALASGALARPKAAAGTRAPCRWRLTSLPNLPSPSRAQPPAECAVLHIKNRLGQHGQNEQ